MTMKWSTFIKDSHSQHHLVTGAMVGTPGNAHADGRQTEDLRMRSWNTQYRVSLGGIEYFPFTIRSFAPSSKGCCRKHSRYKMQPRACGGTEVRAGPSQALEGPCQAQSLPARG